MLEACLKVLSQNKPFFGANAAKEGLLCSLSFQEFPGCFSSGRTSVKRQTTMEDSEIRLDKFFS